MTTKNTSLCAVDGVSKTFTTVNGMRIEALTKISFKIYDKEFLVLIGPSGCGKTTMLRLLAGFDKPSDGSIKYRTGTHKFGFVFQSPTLMPWRTVEQNISLPLEMQHKTKYSLPAKVRTLLTLLNLTGHSDQYPNELSGGMQQRVAIARALINDPTFLFMDEPFSALDELLRQKLNFELLRIREKVHQTIIFVTHNITEAVILADRLLIFSIHPNTITRIEPIVFKKRSPDLLNSPHFYQTVARVRKLLEK